MLIRWYDTISSDFPKLGKPLGLLCVGSCEQHSEYLPVGTDGLLGERICELAAEKAKSTVLMLPVQRIGYSPHHRAFPGYITLSQDTMFHYLVEVLRSVYESGLEKILIVNAHGGNQSCLQTVVNEMGATYGKHALLVRYWDLIADEVKRIRESPEGGMGHAGEFEASLMMHHFPKLADPGRFGERQPAKGNRYHSPDLFARNAVYQFKNFDEYSETGNVGQPQFASEAKGKMFSEAAAAALADLIDFYMEDHVN